MKKIKITFISIILILLAVIMWRESHLSYEEYIGRQQAKENEGQTDLTFPQEYAEQVTEMFSFQAQVITGEAFDPNDIYAATASVVYPDPEIYVSQFLTASNAANPDGKVAVTSVRTGEERNQYWWQEPDAYLLIETERVYFQKEPLLEAIGAVARFSDYGETNNTQLFVGSGEFEDFSAQNAWELAMAELSGLDMENYDCYEAVALHKETLNEQQELFIEQGLYQRLEYDPLIEVFTEAEEGYYLYCSQTLNGLTVFDGYYADDAAENGYYSFSFYVTRDGIAAIDMPVLFSFDCSEENVRLCSFETIVSTLKQHYDTSALTNPIEVTEMRLVEYPVSIGENEFRMIPVWLCIMEENYNDGFFVSKNVIAVNGLTGEEMPELGK